MTRPTFLLMSLCMITVQDLGLGFILFHIKQILDVLLLDLVGLKLWNAINRPTDKCSLNAFKTAYKKTINYFLSLIFVVDVACFVSLYL